MLVARVGRNEVEQDPDPELSRGRNQRVEVFERPEVWVDAEIVRDVISPVAVRRGEGRIEPDAVDAEPVEIVQSCTKPNEVPDAVVVRVRERSRIRLVENAAGPPRLSRRSHAQRYPGQRGS